MIGTILCRLGFHKLDLYCDVNAPIDAMMYALAAGRESEAYKRWASSTSSLIGCRCLRCGSKFSRDEYKGGLWGEL